MGAEQFIPPTKEQRTAPESQPLGRVEFAAAATYPPVGPCPGNAPHGRILDRWVTGPSILADKVVTLACGSYKWGLRHIWFGDPSEGTPGHEQDWENLGFKVGATAVDIAVWAMSITVRQPGTISYRSTSDSWAYGAPFEIRDSRGRVLRRYTSVMGVSDNFGNILTAFYQR
jgi:hypothetical protein